LIGVGALVPAAILKRVDVRVGDKNAVGFMEEAREPDRLQRSLAQRDRIRFTRAAATID
jgi:hypothetical protein